VKTNSIFKDRLYSLPSSGRITSAETKIIKRILDHSKCDIPIEKLSLVCFEEDYDFYEIRNNDGIFELKFSLDHKSEKFIREIKNIKNCKSIATSKYLDDGIVKVGDKILYLICESKMSESLFDYGRSYLSTELNLFCDIYEDFASRDNYRITYKTILNKLLEESDMSSIFDQDQKSYIESHSDYNRCELIINNLKSDIKQRLKLIPKKYTGNIVGDFNKNSLFVTQDGFSFKDLRYACKGHFYSDVINLVLFHGFNKNIEKAILNRVSDRMGVPINQELYDTFYEIQLRVKALQYLLQYLKEVYLYESSRIEIIISIIDSFSQNYQRLCKIPIIKDHRRFILTNITEPILESKLED